MKLSAALFWWSLLTALIVALSLGPSFAHVLEAWPRLTVWPPELWRETTVFGQQFVFFAYVGAPMDVAAVVAPAVLAAMLHGERRSFWPALASAMFFALALAAWFTLVMPANAVLATWTPGAVPAEFAVIRDRWEIGHMVVAALKLVGFGSLTGALLVMRRAA